MPDPLTEPLDPLEQAELDRLDFGSGPVNDPGDFVSPEIVEPPKLPEPFAVLRDPPSGSGSLGIPSGITQAFRALRGGFVEPPPMITIDRAAAITHSRHPDLVVDKIKTLQTNRGWTDEFVNGFISLSDDEQRVAMGNLITSDPRIESLSQWWERVTGDRGALQVAVEDFIPYVSDLFNKSQVEALLLAGERYEHGTDDQLDRLLLTAFIIDGHQQNANFGVQGAKILYSSVPLMLDFLVTKKPFALGRAAGRKSMERVLKGLTGKMRIPLTNISLKSGFVTLGGVAAGAAIQLPAADIIGIKVNALHRMLPGFTVDQAGALLLDFDSADDEFEALWGAAIDGYIEYFSERTGPLLGVGAGMMTRAAAKFGLKSAMVNSFVRKLGRAGGGAGPQRFRDAMADAGFNGIAGEIFEERFGDILRLATGEVTWAELIERSSDWRNWAAEALAFSIPVVGGMGITAGASVGAQAIAGGAALIHEAGLAKANKPGGRFDVARQDLQSIVTAGGRRGDVLVDATQLQERAQAIAESGRDPADVIEREFLLERGGPNTLEEQQFLDLTDPMKPASGELSHDEVAARPREEREEEAQKLQDIIQTQSFNGKPLALNDPKIAQARRMLSSLMRIARQEGEITFALPQEPVVPQPDNALQVVGDEAPQGEEALRRDAAQQGEAEIVEVGGGTLESDADRDAREARDARSDIGAGRPSDQEPSGRTTRLVRLTREDRSAEGLFVRFSATGPAAGRERARIIKDGVVDLAQAGINLYRSGRRGEFVVLSQTNFLSVIEGNFNLLSKRHPDWAAVRAEMRERTGGEFDYGVFIAVAKEHGFEGYIETEEGQPTEGFVTLWRDIAPEEIISTEKLTPERKRELLAGAPLIESDEEREADAQARLDEDHQITGNITEFFATFFSFNQLFALSAITENPEYKNADSQEGRILRARAFLITRGHDSRMEVVEPEAGSANALLAEGMAKLGVTLEFVTGAKGMLGMHDPVSQSILISIDESSEAAIRQTFTHEWVHFLKSTRRQAWIRFHQRIVAVDSNGLQLAGLDYYKRLHPGKVDWAKFMLWFATPLGQNEAVSVYVDQRMETTGFYDQILNRDMRTFELYREKIFDLIDAVGKDHPDVEVMIAIKELADSFFEQTQAENEMMAILDEIPNFDLRGPEPHSEILAAGMRSIRSMTRKQFEESGLIAKPWVDVDLIQTGPTNAEITKQFKTTKDGTEGMLVLSDGRIIDRANTKRSPKSTRPGQQFTMHSTLVGRFGFDTLSFKETGVIDFLRATGAVRIQPSFVTHAGGRTIGVQFAAVPSDAARRALVNLAKEFTTVLWEVVPPMSKVTHGHGVGQRGMADGLRAAAKMIDTPEGAITHRDAKNDEALAIYWATEMRKAIEGGRTASKKVIRVSEKLTKADDIIASRALIKKQFEGEDNIVSPLVILMTGREELDMTATGHRGLFKGADIARALDKRARKLGHVIKYNAKGKRSYTGKQRERIVQSLMEEIRLGFASGIYNGSGWYDKSIKEMIHWAAADFPELEVSQSHAAIFKLLIAITSNGNVVRRNYQAAKRIYGKWSETADKITITHKGKQVEAPEWGTGSFPTVNHEPSDVDKDLIPLTRRTKVMRGSLPLQDHELNGFLWSRRGWPMRAEMHRLNEWMELDKFKDGSGTPAPFIAWLLEKQSVGELRQDPLIGKKHAVSDEAITLVNRRAIYLGPKLGAFFQNMMGIHDLLTMDVWFARMWNRLTGTLMLTPAQKKKALPKAHGRIRELGEDLFNEEPTQFAWKDVVASENTAIQWAIRADQQIQSRNGQDVDPDLKKAVESMKNANEGVIASPGTGAERAAIRDVFKEVRERLKDYGREHNVPQLRNLQMSDIQAILWYNEQSFWNAFGVSKAQTASEDYGTAAKRDVQESDAARGRTDAETAIFVGGGRIDGRGRRALEGGRGDQASELDEAVEDGIVGALRRRDGGIDIELTAARQRLIDAGYSSQDAGELVTQAVINVSETNTRKISVSIEALEALPVKSLSAGMALLSGRQPVTGKQQALFVDPPVARTQRKRSAPGAKMSPEEAKHLRRTLRSEEKGRKAGKIQGVQAATQRVVGIVESIFGKESGKASANEVAAMNRALKARTPEQATLAAVALIRSQAQIERARLMASEKARRDAVRAAGRQETLAATQKERNKAEDLQFIKDTMLRVIQTSGLPKNMVGTFNRDLVEASTRQAIGRALKKIDRLGAQVRFNDAVEKYHKAVRAADKAAHTVFKEEDRAQVRQWRQTAEPALFLPKASGEFGRRKRAFDDPEGYDNAASVASLTAEFIQERVTDRRAEKRAASKDKKDTKDSDVGLIMSHLGWDPKTQTFKKEVRQKRKETQFADRERSWSRRVAAGELYKDVESATRRAERRGKGDGVLTRLISRRMKEQEEEYNSDLRDETALLEKFVQEAGFRNLSFAFQQLMGTFGKTSTTFVDVTLQGRTFQIPLDEALQFLALDTDTLAKIAKGRAIKLRNMGQRLKLVITMEEVEAIKADLEPKYGDLVRAIKARLETSIRPRLFEVLMRLKGAEPTTIPGYFPTAVDRAATDSAGLAKAYREGGFSAIRQAFLENMGFTKEREEDASAPFVLNGLLASYISHIDQALKIIHMAEATRDASMVLLDQNVADAINRTSGKKLYTTLQTMLIESSLVQRDTIPGGTNMMQVWNSGVATSYILLNPGTYIRQMGGVSKLWNEMPTKTFAMGIARIRPGSLKEMKNNSGFFYSRYSGDTMSRYSPVAGSGLDGLDNIAMTQGLKAFLNAGVHGDFKGLGKSWNRILRSIKFLDWFDAIPARIAWEGYKWEGEQKGLKDKELMKYTSLRAGFAVRNSQNTSSPLDAGAVVMNTRESFWRYFFLFTTDPMKSYNQIYQAYHTSPAKAAKASMGVLGNIIWSAYATNFILEVGSELLGTLIAQAFGDDPNERLRKERLLKAFYRANWRAIEDTFGMFPAVGDAAVGLVRATRGGFQRGSIMEPIVFEAINDMARDTMAEIAKMFEALSEDEYEEFALHMGLTMYELSTGALKLVGDPTLMPYYRARRVLEPAQDILPDPVREFMFGEPTTAPVGDI